MQGKALYNLLRLSYLEDPTLDLMPWQVEDYRKLSDGELFDRLKAHHLPLTKESFLQFAQKVDSPEELTEALWVDEEYTETFDQIYLLLFDLWRRYLPEKQSLSLFCNDLDHLIFLYDQEQLEDEQTLQEALLQLETLLDEHVDRGLAPQEVFSTISDFCAHNLESFIHDYISSQIDQGNGVFASELLDGFYEYVENKKWLDILRMRLLIMTDLDEGKIMLRRILGELEEEPDLELLFSIAHFLVHHGDAELFLKTVQISVPLLQTEADFQELLTISCAYYRLSDQTEKEEKMTALLAKRDQISMEAPFSQSDGDLKTFMLRCR